MPIAAGNFFTAATQAALEPHACVVAMISGSASVESGSREAVRMAVSHVGRLADFDVVLALGLVSQLDSMAKKRIPTTPITAAIFQVRTGLNRPGNYAASFLAASSGNEPLISS